VAESMRRPVAVMVGNAIAMLVAKAATTAVPIIFASGGDPVQDGLVSNLNRPGGNVTGVNFVGAPLGAKRLELLRQLVPNATTIAMLVNPNTTQTEGERGAVQAAAQSLGQQLLILDVSNDRKIESAFAMSIQRATGAMLVGAGPFFDSRRERLIALAARHLLPAMYVWPEAADIGGLMSYGTSQKNAYRQAGVYAGRILKGEKPADLPVIESSKLELVINLKTAKSLGLEVPATLLARADEVIE
jgi:putative ABC transport system substrate-binding protein